LQGLYFLRAEAAEERAADFMAVITQRGSYERIRPQSRPTGLLRAEQAVLGVLMALALTLFVVQGFCVSGACMEPHLRTGERVLAWKLAYAVQGPQRGDIVIFHYPRDPREIYVKRIIGLPGETVSMHAGQIAIDSKPLPEPYRIKAAHGDMAVRFIPHDEYFVMGDNRDVSDDSRYWGDLPKGRIIGRAVASYWPLRGAHVLK